MECNRDEAIRAKEIAEKKFLANDIEGAKKFALKAQNLFPSLDGINQMIATLDVYISSSTKLDWEKDWYAILCVNSSADDETVKKQYRKLALQLHPDKNKSVGAEGAFQLISQAWSILSDKSKRMQYDHKRFGKAFQPKSTTVKNDHPAPNTSNGFATSAANNAARKPRAQKSNATSSSSSQPSKSGTFWTACNSCKMQFEYLKAYLNLNLLCPSCHKPFVATEIAAPTKVPNHSAAPPSSKTQQAQQNSNLNSSTNNGPDFSGNSKFQWAPFSRTTGPASATASSTAAAEAANVHQTYEKVRREREEAQAAARSGLKRSYYAAGIINSGPDGIPNPKVDKPAKRRRGVTDDKGNAGVHPASRFKYGMTSRKFLIRRGYPQARVIKTLVTRSRDEVKKTVEAMRAARAAKAAEKGNSKKKSSKENAKEKAKEAVNKNSTDQATRVDEVRRSNSQAPSERHVANTENAGSEKEAVEPVSIDVPDPDFYDFDKDRSEGSFKGDEIWATYDDEDGMPRYYAFIQKVNSYQPFKVRMSFLASKSNTEFGPLNWVSSGFAKTSGEFRVVRYEVKDTLNIFSHKVKWEKAPRGVIKIVPRRGQIWALYRNWSPDWNENTPDEVIYKYDMVEVLEDYNEEQGLSISPLVKIAGFKTIFHRHPDPNKVKRIPKEEMFRFSHQVPSHVLTGDEGDNAPKGCYELDPAATPLELLQVVTESKDDEVMQVSELQQRETVF